MAIEVIDQANPPPLPSQLPVECLILAEHVHSELLDKKTHESVKAYRRAADYIAAGEYCKAHKRAELMRIAAMIFLKDNVLVERDLQAEDIKPRLLGMPKRRNTHF